MHAADAAARFPAARALLSGGVAAHSYPAAVIEVGRENGPLWREAFGALSYAADSPRCTVDTVFDLASLTKVIATTSLTMAHVSGRRLSLDARVADLLPAWRGADRETVTVRHLLAHASGLPAHARLWEQARGRHDYQRIMTALPLEYPPGSQSVYSDPGFILLGFLLEDLGGDPLDTQFAALIRSVEHPIGFLPPATLRDRIAPTEIDPWRGHLLQGEVHDENAAALGGVAGHAGLFGSAGAVGAHARLVLSTFRRGTSLGSPDLMRTFAARTNVPASSRALGWDTMLPTSSCGTKMSATAIGHTGFTGTSLWIDHERDLYVVLLTNRVHPTRTNEAFRLLRPRIHDAVVDGLPQ